MRAGMRSEAPRFFGHDEATAVAVESTAPESGVHAIDEVVREGRAVSPLLDQVTLVVYAWKNVEPGTLSWVFPSLAAALAAARTMTNAVGWSIVAGRRDADVDVTRERSSGTVLLEQTA